MNLENEILKLTDNMDINEENFEFILPELTDLEKKRIKDNIKNKVFKAKRRRRAMLIASFLGVLLISAAFFTKPALAEGAKLFQGIYKLLGFNSEYKEYSEYKGVTKEENGYKVTVEDVIGTEKKFMVGVKVTSENKFTKADKTDYIHVDAALNDSSSSSAALNFNYVDDYTLILWYEKSILDKFPKRGEVKVNVSKHPNEENKDTFNMNFNFKVDFSKAFKNTKNINISKNITLKDKEINIKSLYTSPLETRIMLENFNANYDFLLQLDDKIYKSKSGGGNDNAQNLVYGVTVEDINKARKISVIPLVPKVNLSDFEARNKLDKLSWEEMQKSMILKEENNVKYPAKYTDVDGVEGSIYKVERSDSSLKVYIYSVENSLLKATNLRLPRAGSSTNSTAKIYKDNDKTDGWIKEFKIDEDERKLEISIFPINPGYYEIGKAVEIYKR